MKVEERYYKTEAKRAVKTEYENGVRRQMVVQATGTGKTITFSELFNELQDVGLKGQMLVLAHTEELVKQNYEKLKAINPFNSVGIEMADSYANPNDDIVVASVATLGRKDSKRVERFDWNNFDKVVVDEAHHSTGDSYRRILDATGVLAPDSSKLLLGFTATPRRPDGLALSDIYEKVSYTYSIRQAITDGWLVDVRGYRVKTATSLKNVSVTAGDFSKGELSAAVDNEPRNEQIVDTWKKYGQNRQTVVYCVDIQHAKDVAEAFKKGGVSADYLWGEDPDRAAKLQAHKDGKISVLCNCQVLIEGYDDWRIGCVILAAPTMSEIKFIQEVGRGLRTQEGTGNLKLHNLMDGAINVKRDCIVIDVVDDSQRHSLMTIPTLMGIPSSIDLKGGSLIAAIAALEKAQEENPSIDLMKVADLDDLKTIVEKVDLFDIKFPAEVEENSELTWYRAYDGGFKMILPMKTGWMRIIENALGKWSVIGEISDEPLEGVRNSLEAAFKAADEQIRKRVGSHVLACIKREATWHNKPVGDKQKTLLQKLFPKRVFPWEHMTSGQASRLISERLGRKK